VTTLDAGTWNSYVVPLPVNVRPRGAEAAIFRTHVSLVWFQVLPEVVDDFDALVVKGRRGCWLPTIFTFGGDRERFELPPEVNATRIDNDVWRVDLLGGHAH